MQRLGDAGDATGACRSRHAGGGSAARQATLAACSAARCRAHHRTGVDGRRRTCVQDPDRASTGATATTAPARAIATVAAGACSRRRGSTDSSGDGAASLSAGRAWLGTSSNEGALLEHENAARSDDDRDARPSAAPTGPTAATTAAAGAAPATRSAGLVAAAAAAAADSGPTGLAVRAGARAPALVAQRTEDPGSRSADPCAPVRPSATGRAGSAPARGTDSRMSVGATGRGRRGRSGSSCAVHGGRSGCRAVSSAATHGLSRARAVTRLRQASRRASGRVARGGACDGRGGKGWRARRGEGIARRCADPAQGEGGDIALHEDGNARTRRCGGISRDHVEIRERHGGRHGTHHEPRAVVVRCELRPAAVEAPRPAGESAEHARWSADDHMFRIRAAADVDAGFSAERS